MPFIDYLFYFFLSIYYRKDIRLIKQSKYWDESFYCNQVTNWHGLQSKSILHYILFGEKLGFSPSEVFSVKCFIKENNLEKFLFSTSTTFDKYANNCLLLLLKDNNQHNFIVHSCEYELLINSKYFDEKYYLEQYLDVKEAKVNPVEHYLIYGFKEHRNPSASFHNDYFMEYNNINTNPIVFYEQQSKNNVYKQVFSIEYVEILKSGLFDDLYYTQQYPDVAAVMNPLEHFVKYGYRENRNPSVSFDCVLYKEIYNCSQENPLLDYINSKTKKITNRNMSFAPKNILCIGIRQVGGIGDVLMDISYVYSILEDEFCNTNSVKFTIYTRNDLSFFSSPKVNVTKFLSKCEWYENNDICIESCRLWVPLKYNETKTQKLFTKFSEFMQKNLYAYQDLFHCRIQYNLYQQFCRIRNINRMQQMDPFSIFSNKDIKWFSVSNESKQIILNKHHLNRNYITINCCCDSSFQTHNKIWSFEYYQSLIELLKQQFPNIDIVQVGNSEICPTLNNTDICLLNATNLSDLSIILENSMLHIDSEGGLVHLCHLLETKCAVIFGPTSPLDFGYNENLNIYNNKCCENGCHWITDNWQTNCLNKNKHQCLNNITPDQVFKLIETVLSRDIPIN